MKKLIIYILLFLILPRSILAQSTVGSGGDYSTLSYAFTAINEGNLTGNITLQIISSITETDPTVLYQNGYNGTADYTSVLIYPTGSGYTIDGNFDGPLIDFSGASNVTFDGRVNQTGSADLIITNINPGVSASTIRFTESANTNTIKYCIIKGSGTGALTSGIVYFSTSLTGSGNSGNTIDGNYITCNSTNRPFNAILSSGSSGFENSGNNIIDNNIYDFLNKGVSSNGINLDAYTTSWNISGNSFYETTPLIPTGTLSPTFYAIKINNPSGSGFAITGNHIGGSSALCSGIWTKTNARNNIFYAIYLNVGTATVSSIQNNTIKNFAWSNSGNAAWTAINISGGNVNIGTTTGNTVGDANTSGSITVTGGSNNTSVYGINIAGGGNVDCQNNIIGAVTTANGALNSSNFTGINKTITAGTTTINNNYIGSLTQINSIYASSASTSNAQSVFGISNAGTGNVTINNNTISNITNGTTNSTVGTAGLINGIRSTDGINTIANNTIHDLTISNANTASGNTSSVCGIALTGSTIRTVSGNEIYNLKNTFSTFAGSITGLYFTGNTGANIVSENFIHNLSVTGASSVAASIYGLQISAGATTYSNNIISLDGNSQTSVYGIYETGAAGNNNNLYFNSVYINGIPATGSLNSYALYSAVTSNIRNFRNNIFMNARSNSGATGKHYAVYIVSSGGSITIDYNDYYVSGTGGVLGYLAGDITTLAAWKIATGDDFASLANDPAFVNGGGTAAEDYLPTVALGAVSGTGVLTDFNGAVRSGTPTMGAFEAGSCSNPTSGGIIASAQSGCIPFDPVSFTSTIPAKGFTGTFLEYKWQESITSSAAGFSDISSSNSATYNPGVLIQTTWYKRLARVSCIGLGDWTGAAESNVLMVTVNPLPDIGLTVGGSGATCSGTGKNITVDFSEAGVNYQLRIGLSPVGIPVTGTGATINLPTGNLSATTTFNILATNAITNCAAQLTQTVTVTVNSLPNIGLIVGGTGSICSGTSTNITVSLSEANTNYQLRNDNANETVGTPVPGNGGTINLPTAIMTYNIQYNILATNTITNCSAQLTEKEIVSIDPPSVGGSINGTATVTYGSSSGIMTLTSYTGIIQRWEKRFNSGSWTTISNTNATYSETPASAGTWGYRAVVKSGTCAEANSAEFSITVNKKALSVTADNKSKNYGASLPVFTVTYSGFVNGDVAPATLPAITTTATAASPAGSYPINASGAADPNYTISYVAGTLTVDKVPLTITADNNNKLYGAPLPVFTVTYSGLVNGDVATATLPTITTTATTASPVATYPITASGAADPNYNISYVAGILTVDKVTLTVTADNKSKNYGDVNPVLTITFNGFVGSEDQTVLDLPPSITTTALQNSNAGTYPITVSGASDNNYTFIYIDGILTINKSDQTISFSVLPAKTYGDPDFTPSATASSGLSISFTSDNPAVATIIGGNIRIVGAGSALITASQPGDGNFNPATPVINTITVGKAAITFTADNKSKEYLAEIPVLTYTVSAFVNGETISVLDILPVIQTTAVQNSPIGDYPITISGGSDNNYSYTFIPGILTITKNQQVITFTDFPAKLLVGDTYTLVATSTSDLPVQFESMDVSLATVSGDQLTGVFKGMVQIRAFHPGDLNWDPAEVFATVEIYSTHKDIMYLFTPNNDGFNDQWELPDLDTWGKCDVKVYNRWGKLVFADANYNNLWEGTSNGSPLPEGAYFFIIKTENSGVFKGTVNIVR